MSIKYKKRLSLFWMECFFDTDFEKRLLDNTVQKKLPPKREYRITSFGNYCLIAIRCRKNTYLAANMINLFGTSKRKS